MTRIGTFEGIRQRAALFAATLCALLAISIGMTAKPAAAITYVYPVNPNSACSHAYGGGAFAASFYWWSPDALYCYGLGFPIGISWQGALDRARIDRYCKARYGWRAVAAIHSGWWFPTLAWDCRVTYFPT